MSHAKREVGAACALATSRSAEKPTIARSAAPPAREIVRSCARIRGGAHGQLPGGEGAPGQGKEQRKEGRQEVRGEEWSEGDERHGRWVGITTREECLAVEHRGSDRDTRQNQRSDPCESDKRRLLSGCAAKCR